MKSIPAMEWPTLQNFRKFDADAATNIDKKDHVVQGSKVFKNVLIPTTSGTLPIPSVSFSYFDPNARAYKTLETSPLSVVVTGDGAVPSPRFFRWNDTAVRHQATPG